CSRAGDERCRNPLPPRLPRTVCVEWALGDSEPGASVGQHLLRGRTQPCQLLPHPGIKRWAGYLRRKVHDRRLPGQNSLRARIRSWAFVRRGHPRHRSSAPVSHSLLMGQLAQRSADRTVPLHLRTGALSQKFGDREKSVDRACQKIHEAASHGAELIAFTETWLAGYPYWGEGWESKLQNWIPVRVQFYDQALLIPSEDTERLCHAAAKANAHVVIGCNEMDSRRGVHTMYNTLLFIEWIGKLLGRHRETVNLDYAHGGSQIVAPLGIPLVPPTSGDTILYAECQADMIKVWKAIIDTVGHYARPDIVRLQYMKSAEPSLAELAVEALEKKSPDELEAIAERQGLGRQELESAIERLAR